MGKRRKSYQGFDPAESTGAIMACNDGLTLEQMKPILAMDIQERVPPKYRTKVKCAMMPMNGVNHGFGRTPEPKTASRFRSNTPWQSQTYPPTCLPVWH